MPHHVSTTGQFLLVLRMTTFPPPSNCSIVFVPSQLLAHHRPLLLFQIVIEMVSVLPGSPISVNFTRKVPLPSIPIEFNSLTSMDHLSNLSLLTTVLS